VERIDKKLANGVNDSDGHIGARVTALIDQLAAYAKNQPDLEPLILGSCDDKTNFDFDQALRARLG